MLKLGSCTSYKLSLIEISYEITTNQNYMTLIFFVTGYINFLAIHSKILEKYTSQSLAYQPPYKNMTMKNNYSFFVWNELTLNKLGGGQNPPTGWFFPLLCWNGKQ